MMEGLFVGSLGFEGSVNFERSNFCNEWIISFFDSCIRNELIFSVNVTRDDYISRENCCLLNN